MIYCVGLTLFLSYFQGCEKLELLYPGVGAFCEFIFLLFSYLLHVHKCVDTRKPLTKSRQALRLIELLLFAKFWWQLSHR